MTGPLNQLLRRLQAADGIDLVAVISMDGLLIDAAAGLDTDAEQIAATACNGLLMARALGMELGRGEPEQVILAFVAGVLLLAPLDEDLALLMLAPRDTNLGRMRLLARKYCNEIVKAATI